MQTVIALYSKTATMVEPWLAGGYEAVIVDLQHPEGESREGRLTRIGADMRTWIPSKRLARADVAFVAAFPPCDHTAVSGARWFKGKGLGKLPESIVLFERAIFWCEWFGAPYFAENPVSTIASYYRTPDYTFDPSQYTLWHSGDNYTKKTCLWTGNGFVMPAKAADDTLGPPDDRIHKAPPSDERADFRAATPLGFSRAVFEANHQLAARTA